MLKSKLCKSKLCKSQLNKNFGWEIIKNEILVKNIILATKNAIITNLRSKYCFWRFENYYKITK
jgi:hypothetical protein